MTDREALLALLERFGLEPWPRQVDQGRTEHDVVLKEEYGNNVDGYPGFYALFKFDADGKFESLGIWE